MFRSTAATCLIWLVLSLPAHAEIGHEEHHALHPPVSITAGHTLPKGGFAIGYAYDRQRFEDLRDGTTSLDANDAINSFGFMRAPLDHDIEQHDIAVMYAPTDRITLMANLPVLRKQLREVDGAGLVRTTHSEGVGDLSLTAITRFIERGPELLFFSAELGTPTGSIRETDPTGQRLPYTMQLGTGSWHIATGLTYQGHAWRFTWGGQIRTLFRLNTNDLGYTHGHRYSVSGWVARRWVEWLSSSLRLEWHKWGNFRGEDSALDPTRSPTEDARHQSGEHLDIAAGLDIHLPFTTHQSVAVEAVFPVWRDIDGPQIDEEWRVRAGWRWAF